MKGKNLMLIAAIGIAATTSQARADDITSFVDIRVYSMGKITTALSTAANPAGLALERPRGATIGYVNRFSLKELSTYAASVNLPAKPMDFTIYASRYGMDAYNENKASIAVSRKLNEWFALGVRLNYHLLQMAESINNIHALTADIGMLIKPLDILTLGVVINNPVRKGIVKGNKDEKLPASFAVGATCQPLQTLLLTIEVEKNTQEDPWIKFGAEYSPIDVLDLRIGCLGAPFTPTFGIGLHLARFTIDAGAKWHARLGPELLCGLGYSF